MPLHEGETLLYSGRPSPRSSLGFYLTWVPLAVAPGVLATLLNRLDISVGFALWKWWLISLLLVLVVILRDLVIRYAVLYRVTTERIHIRRGILSRADQSTDIDRVQNINIRQSFLERILGVGSVDFDTAGTNAREADFLFRGVANPSDVVRRLEAYLIARERTRHSGTGL